MLALGPIPDHLSVKIQKWIDEASKRSQLQFGNSLLLTGGPAWSNYILPDGTILLDDYSGDEPIEMEDGAHKVMTVAIAAKHKPEFAAWLPKRSANATDCSHCDSSGWLRFNDHDFACSSCYALGWIV